MKTSLTFLVLSILCNLVFAKQDTIQVSEYLQIVPINGNTFLHISYIPYKDGEFSCNGLVYIRDGQAAVMDTPVGEEASVDLIRWIMVEKKATVNYLIVNHFHEDCISGLTAFVGTGCQSISHKTTCKLADLESYNCTQRYFNDSIEINLAGTKIISYHFVFSHTDDNIVTYIPADRILFGGCMIKEIGADKGNLLGAKKSEWPKTVLKVKEKFPKVRYVIPGHGKPGKRMLIDYTIELFSS